MNILFVNGMSHTGKSRRVEFLIKYLMTFEEPKDLMVNGIIVGFCFENMKIAFLGKWIQQNGVKRFQGVNAVFKRFKDVDKNETPSDNLSNAIVSLSKQYHLVVEGSSILNTSRYFTSNLLKDVRHVNTFVAITYVFENFIKYDTELRLKFGNGRRGTEKAWKRNLKFEEWRKKFVLDGSRNTENSLWPISFLQRSTDDVSFVGNIFFTHISEGILGPSFDKFCYEEWERERGYKSKIKKRRRIF